MLHGPRYTRSTINANAIFSCRSHETKIRIHLYMYINQSVPYAYFVTFPDDLSVSFDRQTRAFDRQSESLKGDRIPFKSDGTGRIPRVCISYTHTHSVIPLLSRSRNSVDCWWNRFAWKRFSVCQLSGIHTLLNRVLVFFSATEVYKTTFSPKTARQCASTVLISWPDLYPSVHGIDVYARRQICDLWSEYIFKRHFCFLLSACGLYTFLWKTENPVIRRTLIGRKKSSSYRRTLITGSFRRKKKKKNCANTTVYLYIRVRDDNGWFYALRARTRRSFFGQRFRLINRPDIRTGFECVNRTPYSSLAQNAVTFDERVNRPRRHVELSVVCNRLPSACAVRVRRVAETKRERRRDGKNKKKKKTNE